MSYKEVKLEELDDERTKYQLQIQSKQDDKRIAKSLLIHSYTIKYTNIIKQEYIKQNHFTIMAIIFDYIPYILVNEEYVYVYIDEEFYKEIVNNLMKIFPYFKFSLRKCGDNYIYAIDIKLYEEQNKSVLENIKNWVFSISYDKTY